MCFAIKDDKIVWETNVYMPGCGYAGHWESDRIVWDGKENPSSDGGRYYFVEMEYEEDSV